MTHHHRVLNPLLPRLLWQSQLLLHLYRLVHQLAQGGCISCRIARCVFPTLLACSIARNTIFQRVKAYHPLCITTSFDTAVLSFIIGRRVFFVIRFLVFFVIRGEGGDVPVRRVWNAGGACDEAR